VVGLYAINIWLLEGLQYHSNNYDVTKSMHVIRDLHEQQAQQFAGFPDSVLNNLNTQYNDNKDDDVIISVINRIHKLYILPHHPCSARFVDYVLDKVLMLFVSMIVATFYLTRLERSVRSDEDEFVSRHSSLLMWKGLLIVCNLIWWIWLLMVRLFVVCSIC
jgi:hypothetical protein